MNHLNNNFYTIPNLAKTAMTRKQLKETLLATEGWIIACGRIWNIKSKPLGVGVYNVSLRLKTYN